MLFRSCACLLSVIAWFNVAPVTGKVLLRIAAGPLPSAKALGVNDVVLKWPVRDAASLAQLRALGFHVFLEADSKDLAAAALAAEGANVAGVILDQADADAGSNHEGLRAAMAAYPKLL